MRRQVGRAAAGAAAAVTLGTCAYQWLGQARDVRRFPPPGDVVEVDGRRVHVLSKGSGGPAVVVVPALGAPAVEWATVLRGLPETFSAIVVDRPGLGWSGARGWTGKPVPLAAWTRRLLDVLQLDDVVMVGHSMGGLIARICAAEEPDRVRGLVLVDSSHEDQMTVLGAVDPSVGPAELVGSALMLSRCPAGWRRLFHDLGGRRKLVREALDRGVAPEFAAAHAALALTSACRRAEVAELLGFAFGLTGIPAYARKLGDVPIVVVTAGPAGRESWWEAWCGLQESFLSMSTWSRQVFRRDSGHHINLDDPVTVAEAIKMAVDQSWS